MAIELLAGFARHDLRIGSLARGLVQWLFLALIVAVIFAPIVMVVLSAFNTGDSLSGFRFGLRVKFCREPFILEPVSPKTVRF